MEKRPGSTETRTLLVPCLRDRILQTSVAHEMSRSYEEEFLDVSFAYRPDRGVDRAIARIRQLRDLGYTSIVDADIRSYFDRVDWGLMEESLRIAGEPDWVLSLVSAWIRAPIWDGFRIRARTRGLPQGSPLSPLLANLFLLPLDQRLASGDLRMVRYADDFVCLARSQAQAEEALALVRTELGRLKLELNERKTRITSFDEGLRFLGVLFQKGEIWRPWKEHPSEQGRLLHKARPMPASMLWRFQAPPDAKSLEAQLKRTSQRWLPAAGAERAAEGSPVAYLYLTEQGAVLRKSGERFLVEHEDRIVLDLPYHKLEQVFVFGHVQVTTQAMLELMERDIDLSYFTWSGSFRGSIAPRRGASVLDRMAQFALWQDAARARQVAVAIVANKIQNARATLEWWAAGQNRLGEFAALRESLGASAQRALAAEDTETLMGVEGAAAKAYFDLFRHLDQGRFQWNGRSAHPPRDPINSLLSLAYTLLTRELGALVEGDGLEPALGSLHQIEDRRPSLALDLVEAFRHPVADRLVVRLLESQWLDPGQFVRQEGGGILLSPAALKDFLDRYEHWMASPRRTANAEGPSFRTLLREEVRRYVSFLRKKEGGFAPYRFQPEAEGREEGPPCDLSSATT